MRIMMGVIPLVLAALVATACFYAFRSQLTMRNALPPITNIDRSGVDAILRSHANACLILGTGSMAPAIRAGGEREVVAVAVYERLDFSLLGQGDLVLFDRGSQIIVHQLAQLDCAGWITSGSANDGYDTGRVTRASFRGKVTAIYNINK